jgi:hypothetical protein
MKKVLAALSVQLIMAAGTPTLASTLAIAAQAWSPTMIGEGLAPSDDPESPYFHSTLMAPSWQGRPYAIR